MASRATSIKNRVRAVILVVSVMVMLATATAFVAYAIVRFKSNLVRHLTSMAAVVADNSAASLSFPSKPAAEGVLKALKVEPDIVAAVLYDLDGRVFATYPPALPADLLPHQLEGQGSHFQDGAVVVFGPVILEQKKIGTLYIRSSLEGLHQQFWRYAMIISIVLIGSVAMAYVLSTLLQKRITDPILALTSAAQSVSGRSDYSVRARKVTDDELGTLTDAFNRMLTETEEQQGRLAEQARQLHESREELRRTAEFDEAVMSNMGEGLYTVDSDGLVTSMNPAAEKLFGWTFEELRSRKMHDLTHYKHPDGTPFPASECSGLQVLKQGKALSGHEDVFIRKDGTFFHVLYSSAPIRAGDKIVGLVVVFRDVSERKQAEAGLRTSEERLRLAHEVARIGTFEWNIQTGEIQCSRELEAMYGLPLGASPRTQADWEKLIHGDDRAEVMRCADQSLQTGIFEAEWRVVWPDGSLHWLTGRAQLYLDGAGKPLKLLGVNLDITSQKMFEAKLEMLVAERTARLQETVGELEAFSYSISHDMRAPLRAMQGYSQVLLDDYKDKLDAEAQGYLTRISRAANRLDLLIRDVLAYSRVAKEEIALHPVDLGVLIEDILANHPDLQLPRARVVVEKPLHKLMGHEAYLTQCITNLLGNAVKFVVPGVTPEIHIRSEQLPGNKVRVWFEDNGIGIDPSHQERIFQIFGQVYPEKQYGGTGIGLAIVRKAVQRMGGEVGLESQLDKGTRFWLILNGI